MDCAVVTSGLEYTQQVLYVDNIFKNKIYWRDRCI